MYNEYNINVLKAAEWDVDGAIEELGGIEIYNEIVIDFYNENLERAKKIIEYKKSGDIKNYTIEVHAMKGECMYIGIKHLADLCLEHQLKGEANDIEYINLHFSELMDEVAKALTVIKKYVGK